MENETSDQYVEPLMANGNSVIRVGEEDVILSPFSTYENRVFRKINFSGLSLTDCTFINVTFEDCLILATEFSYSKFSNVRFMNCDLTNSSFLWAKFEGTAMHGCSTPKARFNFAVMTKCTFSDCHLTHTTFDKTVLKGCQMHASALDGSTFLSSTFLDCKLSEITTKDDGVRLKNCTIKRSHFANCNLTRAFIVFSKFYEVTFSRSNLWKANLGRLTCHDSTFHHTGFNEARLVNTTFVRTEMNACRFRLIKPSGTAFDTCRIFACLFEGADLRGAIFFETSSSRNFYGDQAEFATQF